MYPRAKIKTLFPTLIVNGDLYGIRTRECMRERHVS